MRRLFGVLIAFLLAGLSVSAAVISEESLAGKQIKSLEATQPACVDFSFDVPAGRSDAYSILSVNALFQPTEDVEAHVIAYVNGNEIKKLAPSSFQNGWARVIIPPTRLMEGKNTASLCAEPTAKASRITITNASLIGRYQSPDFSPETALERVAENPNPNYNDVIAVKTIVRNQGNEKTDARLVWMDPKIERNDIELIAGNREQSFELKAGEERVFTHQVKVKWVGQLSLPQAQLYYTNVFGEIERKDSTIAAITIQEPEVKLTGRWILEADSTRQGKIAARLALTNESKVDWTDIRVTIMKPAGLTVTPPSLPTIAELRQGETFYQDIAFTTTEAGHYEIACEAAVTGIVNKTVQACETKTVSFEEEKTSGALIAGVVLAVLGAVLCVFFYLKAGK